MFFSKTKPLHNPPASDSALIHMQAFIISFQDVFLILSQITLLVLDLHHASLFLLTVSKPTGVLVSKRKVACVAGAWKQWAKEKKGAREGDTRGVREAPSPLACLLLAHPFFLCPLLPSTQAKRKVPTPMLFDEHCRFNGAFLC